MASAAATPAKVLTKSQMKRAARENKPRTRNVLFNPYRIEWPVLQRAAASAILSAIETHVERFEMPGGVPQEEYRRLLAAGDRAAITARRAELKARAAPLLAARRRHMADCVLGFNAASRALEAGRLSALLVEADTPALETRFLLPLAAGRRCPAVCLSQLRPALERRLGIQTAVLGLTEPVTQHGHHLHPLYRAVCEAALPLRPQQPPPAAAPETTEHAEQTGKTNDTEETGEAGEVGIEICREPMETTETPETQRLGADDAADRSPVPVPFEQADFISLAIAPPNKRKKGETSLLDDFMSIDTVGVPHKKRLALKEARVMKVTLGNKAEKRKKKMLKNANKNPLGKE